MIRHPVQPVALIAIGLLFAAGPCEAGSLEKAVETARQLFSDCQMKHVAQVSGSHADAKKAALALTTLCLDEYEALVRQMAQHNFDTSNEQRMFTIDQHSTMLQIEASLPVVNRYRAESG